MLSEWFGGKGKEEALIISAILDKIPLPLLTSDSEYMSSHASWRQDCGGDQWH